MHYNQDPLRFRRKVAAVATAAGIIATGTACSAETPTQVLTKTVTVTAPAPKPTPATGEAPAPSDKLKKAEANLLNAAIATGLNIAQDAANPHSLSEAYNGTSVGNKHLALANGLENQSGFPEMFMGYDKTTRQVSIWSLTSTNPQAPVSQWNIDGVTMVFQSQDSGLNNLDRKEATGQQLTAQDFINFFEAGNLGIKQIQTTHGHSVEASIDVDNGGSYQYRANFVGVGDATPITDANSQLLDQMSRDIQSTEIELRHGL